MKQIPISIKKIKVDSPNLQWGKTGNESSEAIKYLFIIEEKGLQWEKTFVCERDALLKLRDRINELIEYTSTGEVLKISIEKAKIVDEHYGADKLCNGCCFKLTDNCVTCLFVLQSPLERKLFIQLKQAFISFQTQYPLNWRGERISVEGKSYGDPVNNFQEVLTVVDFYIEKRNTKLCIYTDGHSFHERTEEQAQRDRNIDRKLQELGFQVLRYTGKEVNENIQRIIDDIRKWID